MPTAKRLLTDETGQALVTAINNIVAAVKPNATEIQMSSSDITTVATTISNINNNITSLETAVKPGNNRNDFSEYDTIHKIFGGIRSATDGSAFGSVGAMQNTALRTLLGNPDIGNYVRCNMILVNWSSILCIAVSEASFAEPKMKWLYHADYSDAENYYNQTEWSKVNVSSDIASLNSKMFQGRKAIVFTMIVDAPPGTGYTEVTYTFPEPFNNAPYVFCTPVGFYDASKTFAVVKTTSTTQVVLRVGNLETDNITVSVSCLAIGY